MNTLPKTVAIIGGGPAGLIAAEILSAKGFTVTVYERKPSVGRKFLMAGRGGLNLTHSEGMDTFIGRYGVEADRLSAMIHAFTPQMLRDWCEGLGQKTFIGTSGRVFPEAFKASPLLGAWITRLKNQNVTFLPNHDWQGWDNGHLVFNTPSGPVRAKADATLLALGGASWPRLGTDGSWVTILQNEGVQIAPLRSANCGFVVAWTDMFRQRFVGQALKSVALTFKGTTVSSQIMITDKGIEGGAVYALSSLLREEIAQQGTATIHLDLKPDLAAADLETKLKKPRGRDSFSNYLRKHLNMPAIAVNILMERPDRDTLGSMNATALAREIKNCPLTLIAPFPIDRAISTAGGIMFESLDDHLMLLHKPGVFAAGEMLDWEAPTGGYLLQASFATGVQAAQGIEIWLKR